jgi:outer membrane receptor protein involved in Fe transport
VCLALVLAMLSGVVAAQSPPPAPAASPTPTPRPSGPEDVPAPAKAVADTEQRFADEVVVTATRSERAIGTLPVSVSVLGQPEIKYSPVMALDDLLREVPGLVLPAGSSLTRYPTQSTFSMRGLGGNRALVLLDGVPINDPLTGAVQWKKVPLETVQRVEVARGGAASLFGNYAMGGTVNVLTRPAPGDGASARIAYGSYDTRRVDLGLGKAVGQRATLGLTVSGLDTDGYVRIPPESRGAVDIASALRFWNTQLRADLGGENGAAGFVRAGYYTDDMSLGTPLAKTSQDIFDLAVGDRIPLGTGRELAANAFYQRETFDVFNSALVPGQGRNAEYRSNAVDTPAWLAGGSLQWSGALSASLPLLTAGLDLQRLAADSARDNFNQAGALTSTQNAGGQQDNAGLYAEVSCFPNPRLEILGSARLDYWRNFNGYDDRSPGGAESFPAKQTVQLDPRLSLRYEISRAVALRGAVYRAFRAPSLQDLYRSSASKAQVIEANPALVPETLVGGELGVELSVGGVRGQLNVYQDTIDNIISRVPITITPILTVQPRNLDRARSRGVELVAEMPLAPHWNLSAGYTLADSTAVESADPALVGKQTPEVPRNSASLALRFQLPQVLVVTLRGVYVSTTYADAANKLAYDPHTLVDLYVSRPFGNGQEAFVAVTNLFNERYLDDLTAAVRLGAPLQVLAGLRVRTEPHGNAW